MPNLLSWDWNHIWNLPGVKMMVIGIAIFIFGILNMARNPKKLRTFLNNLSEAAKPKEKKGN